MLRLYFSDFLSPQNGVSMGLSKEAFYHRKENVGFLLILVCLDFYTMGDVIRGSITLPGKGSRCLSSKFTRSV